MIHDQFIDLRELFDPSLVPRPLSAFFTCSKKAREGLGSKSRDKRRRDVLTKAQKMVAANRRNCLLPSVIQK